MKIPFVHRLLHLEHLITWTHYDACIDDDDDHCPATRTAGHLFFCLGDVDCSGIEKSFKCNAFLLLVFFWLYFESWMSFLRTIWQEIGYAVSTISPSKTSSRQMTGFTVICRFCMYTIFGAAHLQKNSRLCQTRFVPNMSLNICQMN